jgi:hypothetical protein
MGEIGAGECGILGNDVNWAKNGDFVEKEYFVTESYKKLNNTRLNIYIAAHLLALLALWILVMDHDPFLLLFFSLVALPLYLFLKNAFAYKERLIISQDYLEYDGMNYSIRVDWKNIDQIVIRKELAGSIECLVLDHSMVHLLTQKTRAFPREFIIPLSGFAEHWRDSDLSQQIKQYAPHLFVQDKEIS